MKKVIYACAMALALGLTACSGGGKASTDSDSVHPENVAATDTTKFEEIIEDGYTITQKGIVPTNGRPMVVDFSAVWCPPCQELKPIFANLKAEYAGRVDMVTIDTDRNKELTKSYGIRNIPTLLFLNKHGEIKHQTTGFIPADSIRKDVKKYLDI